MDTTGGLLTSLSRNLGAHGAPRLFTLATALAVATFVVALLAANVLVASVESVVIAPFRW